MPEQSNDRLEQFFRKAATRADVTFNEEDWKKLEARLDAVDAGKGTAKKTASRITTAVVVGVLLVSTGVWVGMRYDVFSSESQNTPGVDATSTSTKTLASSAADEITKPANKVEGSESEETATDHLTAPVAENGGDALPAAKPIATFDDSGETDQPVESPGEKTGSVENANKYTDSENEVNELNGSQTASEQKVLTGYQQDQLPEPLSHENIGRDLIRTSPAIAERYKQRAVVKLPGAEEEATREAEAMVEEEHASDQKKHVATPRLSLLLFFAPDFSGTSIGQYSAPGKAFGGLIHYHLFDRWTISSGVIKNFKEYTSPGEEYHPPKNYWKYYTNGIIPETIDGSCSILEFPLMVQYTAINSGKSKLNVGIGASSYLMQTESYKYNFDEPNPGAKEGWDSRGSSRFLFNMMNFTIGYERQVLPGLLLGIEPYAKIPLEEIGWSNIRLFSTGASFTVRYTLLRRNDVSVPTRSRGPD